MPVHIADTVGRRTPIGAVLCQDIRGFHRLIPPPLPRWRVASLAWLISLRQCVAQFDGDFAFSQRRAPRKMILFSCVGHVHRHCLLNRLWIWVGRCLLRRRWRCFGRGFIRWYWRRGFCWRWCRVCRRFCLSGRHRRHFMHAVYQLLQIGGSGNGATVRCLSGGRYRLRTCDWRIYYSQ